MKFELQQLTILRTHLLGPGTAAEFPLKRPNPTFFTVWIKTYRIYQVSITSRKNAELMVILWFRSDNFHKLRGWIWWTLKQKRNSECSIGLPCRHLKMIVTGLVLNKMSMQSASYTEMAADLWLMSLVVFYERSFQRELAVLGIHRINKKYLHLTLLNFFILTAEAFYKLNWTVLSKFHYS